MTHIELKGYNAKAFRVTVLLGIPGLLIVFSFFLIGLIARYGVVGGITPLLIGGGLLFMTKRFFRTNYRVGISEEEIVFYRNGANRPMRAPLRPSEIAMIRHQVHMADDSLRIFRRGDKHPYLKIAAVGQSARVGEILIEIGKHVELVRSGIREGWDEYINKETARNLPESIRKLRMQHKNPNKKILLITGTLLFLFFVLPVALLMVNNPNNDYLIGVDEITYNGKPLPLKREEFKQLSPSTVKDSTRVFFFGEAVEWADARTFENISGTFFRDKNGLYREQTNLFSGNKLIPLKGDFDEETFSSVGTLFYKDKDYVYYFDFNLGVGKNPLKRVNVEGIDAPTFEVVPQSYVWYRDANSVYFGDWADFRRCPEVDRETFEVLTWEVAKDKNKVYYLTRFLTAEGGNRQTTERDNYSILKGAHAPSFVMIDQKTFEDRNTTWTIE